MKKIMNAIVSKIKMINKGTICRTILQVAAYANQLVALIGMTSFASSAVYQWISFIVTIIITAVTYWYNNDWSSGAILIGELFDMLEDGKVTEAEIRKFIDKHNKETKKKKTESSGENPEA